MLFLSVIQEAKDSISKVAKRALRQSGQLGVTSATTASLITKPYFQPTLFLLCRVTIKRLRQYLAKSCLSDLVDQPVIYYNKITTALLLLLAVGSYLILSRCFVWWVEEEEE